MLERTRLVGSRSLRLLAVTVALVASEAAMAQVNTRSAAPRPAQAVQPLARATFIATMDEEFSKSDTNKDGAVSKAELASYQQRLAAAALEQRARAMFATMDADRNGQVTAEEFVRANAGSATKIDVTAMMARLDVNRDQKVSIVEYRTLTLTSFDKLDADKDGFISQAEQRAGGLAK